MAGNLSIPITDHNNGSTCTLSYSVRYRPSSSDNWTNVEPQYDSPLIISVLEDDTAYTVEVIRNCCNGLSSAPVTFEVTTTRLATPVDFIATPGNAEVELEWDIDPDAENYILDRATNSSFTSDLEEVFNGFPLTNPANVLDTGLTNGVLYYYRLKAQSAVYIDSNYATVSATPAP